MQSIRSNPKYLLLRQRGYSHEQITEMIRNQQQTSCVETQPPTSYPVMHPNPPSTSSSMFQSSVRSQYDYVTQSRRNDALQTKQHHPSTTYAVPRAPIHLQQKIDKSHMESAFQNAFHQRQMDQGMVQEQHTPLLPSQRILPESTQGQASNIYADKQNVYAHKQHERTPEIKKPFKNRYSEYQTELAKIAQEEEDAFDLLQVPKQYDLRVLAKAYRKAALKYHPDRINKYAESLTGRQLEELNGMFEKVTKAYLFLMDKFQKNQQDKSFHDLRKESQHALKEQSNRQSNDDAHHVGKINLMKGSKFDINLFNRIYNDHRLGDVYDDGYGDWLKNDTSESKQTQLFSGRFNCDIFNSTFEQLKRDDPGAERQLIKKEEPDALILSNASSSFANLGQDNVSDFGGSSGSLEYSDLKEAHTTQAMLIDPSRVESHSVKDIKELQARRSQLSHQRSEKDLARDALLQHKKEQSEKARLLRLEHQDRLGAEQHSKLNGMLTYPS